MQHKFDVYSKNHFNSSPDNKTLDKARLKVFANYKLTITEVMISVFDRVENMVVKGDNEVKSLRHRLLTSLKKNAFGNIIGKGENAGNQHFLLFPLCFLPCHL